MKILSYNIRVLNGSNKPILVKNMVNELKSNILLLQETKMSLEAFIKVGNYIWPFSIRCALNAICALEGLVVLWKPHILDGIVIF